MQCGSPLAPAAGGGVGAGVAGGFDTVSEQVGNSKGIVFTVPVTWSVTVNAASPAEQTAGVPSIMLQSDSPIGYTATN